MWTGWMMLFRGNVRHWILQPRHCQLPRRVSRYLKRNQKPEKKKRKEPRLAIMPMMRQLKPNHQEVRQLDRMKQGHARPE